jgi:hypothetical protein
MVGGEFDDSLWRRIFSRGGGKSDMKGNIVTFTFLVDTDRLFHLLYLHPAQTLFLASSPPRQPSLQALSGDLRRHL